MAARRGSRVYCTPGKAKHHGDNSLTLCISYGALERVLLKLDFSLTVTEQHCLYFYEEGKKKSIFGFTPNILLDQKVRPAAGGSRSPFNSRAAPRRPSGPSPDVAAEAY